MKGETHLSYLSAVYDTAAVLLVLTGVFATIAHSFEMPAIWFSLGSEFLQFGFSPREGLRGS